MREDTEASSHNKFEAAVVNPSIHLVGIWKKILGTQDTDPEKIEVWK